MRCRSWRATGALSSASTAGSSVTGGSGKDRGDFGGFGTQTDGDGAADLHAIRFTSYPGGTTHLHRYATAAGGDSVLVVPFPFGPGYKAVGNGMRVTANNYDYAAGAALLKSTLSFEDFLAAMHAGLIVLNIHTDAFNPGEISGRVGGGSPPR